jgi:hypothetical protein
MGFSAGDVISPGVEYEIVGGVGQGNRPPFPSDAIAFPSPPMTPSRPFIPYTPPTTNVTMQPPRTSDSNTEIWAYAMIAFMAVIIVIVLAIVL